MAEEPLSAREIALLAKYKKRKDWKKKVVARLDAQLAGRYSEERDPGSPNPDAPKATSPDGGST